MLRFTSVSMTTRCWGSQLKAGWTHTANIHLRTVTFHLWSGSLRLTGRRHRILKITDKINTSLETSAVEELIGLMVHFTGGHKVMADAHIHLVSCQTSLFIFVFKWIPPQSSPFKAIPLLHCWRQQIQNEKIATFSPFLKAPNVFPSTVLRPRRCGNDLLIAAHSARYLQRDSGVPRLLI